ncbi:hypothetical protein HY409_02310 [Candidatus Gottesmanbacteria bacterium]|nr:hypothetical protein [Candidatus Gottesmanbacteria bacterium]
MLFTYSLAFAAGAAAAAGLFELFNGRFKHPVSAGFITGVLTFIVNAGIVYFGMPPFTHWLAAGYPILFFVDLAIAAVIVVIDSAVTYEEHRADGSGGYVAAGTFVVFLVVWGMVAAVTPPGAFCDNPGYQRMVALINVADSDAAFPDTNLDSLVRVAPETAMLKASRAIGGDANIGSYLEVNNPYLQKVQGRWVYVVDLKVKDWRAFETKGAVVPGYIVVSATDPQAEAEFRTGYAIRYAPDARWDQDLDRHAYLGFLLGSPYRVMDLRGMEVDEEWNPHYTGTLLRHEVGFEGKVVVGMLDVNPQSGEMAMYTVGEVPEWIDRIWPLELVKSYAGWWGSYIDHRACELQGAAGQRAIDNTNDVVTSAGLEFQVTMTSVGTDQSLTEILYVEPRTGIATRYKLTGATIQAIDNLVDEASREITAEGYEPVECELQVLLGRQVWYCVLTGRGGGEDLSSGSYAGVAFVQVKFTSDNTKVIIAETLEEAYAQLQRQIATESSDDPTLREAQEKIQVEGVIERKASIGQDGFDTTGGGAFLFLIKADDGKTYYCLAPTASWNAALAREGDRVTITAFQELDKSYLTVIDIAIVGAPDFDPN